MPTTRPQPVTISQCVSRYTHPGPRTVTGHQTRCSKCGGSMMQRTGWWSVQEWSAADRYTADSAVSLHRSEAVAHRRTGGSLVVRFVEA